MRVLQQAGGVCDCLQDGSEAVSFCHEVARCLLVPECAACFLRGCFKILRAKATKLRSCVTGWILHAGSGPGRDIGAKASSH